MIFRMHCHQGKIAKSVTVVRDKTKEKERKVVRDPDADGRRTPVLSYLFIELSDWSSHEVHPLVDGL